MMRRVTSILIVALFTVPAAAQSLTGVSGLVTIPTAQMASDGVLTAGFNYLNRAALEYHGGQHHAKSPFVSLVFLPFVEVGLRLTRADSGVEEALGDRTLIARAQLWNESAGRPAVVLGIHDFAGSKRHFHAAYAVASKTLGPASFHLGYGTRLLDAALYEFVGIFGGLAVSPIDGVRLLGEYDGTGVNVGIDAALFGRLHLLLAASRFEAISGGVSYSFDLSH